ncbi:hypothetical protein EV421DRAFT_1912674 [Armillaria borealis]|uniref:Uncharacterized protein n=1 Tax=Armillaria borealis TaxID=47425 RepID=A0AA39IW17_9AGAR|nr:hypothetical protein EV421DRAFT_1912674 [Armillaria borealis]
MFLLDLDVQLSPEDVLLKALTVACLYLSMLSWLGHNMTKIEAPTMKQTWRMKDDPTSLLLNHLLGISETSVEGHLPFQAWASSLPEDSEMGLYALFFVKAFTVLPIEEQALWKDWVEQEKAETREQQETATAKLEVLLPPMDALQFSYRETKALIPENFSRNQAHFDRCMLAFSEFVTECFDEDDEAAHALPFLDELEMHEEPSCNCCMAYMEIDPKTCLANEVVGSETINEDKVKEVAEAPLK